MLRVPLSCLCQIADGVTVLLPRQMDGVCAKPLAVNSRVFHDTMLRARGGVSVRTLFFCLTVVLHFISLFFFYISRMFHSISLAFTARVFCALLSARDLLFTS